MPALTISANWFLFPEPKPRAKLRLFCFPYAGGGAGIFHSWPRDLPERVELCAIQLPGRGNRWSEKVFTQMGPLVRDLAHALGPFLDDCPFAFFGHSLGGLIAFELTRELRCNLELIPVHLFVSGRRAPDLPDRSAPVQHLPDSELMEHLRRLNGTPPLLLENEELMSVMLPILRADFALCENYRYHEEAPLTCPLTVFGGGDDQEVTRQELMGWQRQSSGPFSCHLFAGDHFFLHSQKKPLLEALSVALDRQAPAPLKVTPGQP